MKQTWFHFLKEVKKIMEKMLKHKDNNEENFKIAASTLVQRYWKMQETEQQLMWLQFFSSQMSLKKTHTIKTVKGFLYPAKGSESLCIVFQSCQHTFTLLRKKINAITRRIGKAQWPAGWYHPDLVVHGNHYSRHRILLGNPGYFFASAAIYQK